MPFFVRISPFSSFVCQSYCDSLPFSLSKVAFTLSAHRKDGCSFEIFIKPSKNSNSICFIDRTTPIRYCLNVRIAKGVELMRVALSDLKVNALQERQPFDAAAKGYSSAGKPRAQKTCAVRPTDRFSSQQTSFSSSYTVKIGYKGKNLSPS